MSVSNTTPPQNQLNNSPAAKRGLLTVSILLGLLVFVNIIYFFTKKPVTEEVFTEAVSQKEMALGELQQAFNYTKAQLDSFQTIIPGLEQKIEAQQQELETKRAQIEASIRNGGDLTVARQQIEDFNKQKDVFILEIAKLKEQVSGLRENVTIVRREKEEIEAAYSEVQEKYTEERSSSSALQQEKVKYAESLRKMQEKLDANAFLSVGGIEVKPVAYSGRDKKEKETARAKSVDKLSICFNVAPNTLVKEGEETFQIRILNGDITLGSEGAAGGIGKDKSNNTEFRYTLTATCAYTQSPTTVCTAWIPQDKQFGKGLYTIEIYNHGRKVGSNLFKLK
jgi:hypothetical protein